MRPYLITLAVLALAVGALFQAAETTGVKLIKMFAVIGIFLFGLVGSLALTRWQGEGGRKELERALTGLGGEFLITDWSASGPRLGIPEYLVIGPVGICGITITEMAGGRGRRQLARLAQARRQAAAAGAWAATAARSLLGEEVANRIILVVIRRKAASDDSDDAVTVLNPGELKSFITDTSSNRGLDEEKRLRLTRGLREAALSRASRS